MPTCSCEMLAEGQINAVSLSLFAPFCFVCVCVCVCVCSTSLFFRSLPRYTTKRVPTHHEIQSTLIDIGDKSKGFLHSSQWIGSQEVSYCLNTLLDIECRTLTMHSGAQVPMQASKLQKHFQEEGTPVRNVFAPYRYPVHRKTYPSSFFPPLAILHIPNAQLQVPNAQLKNAKWSMANAKCSMANAKCSSAHAKCSIAHAQCPMANAQMLKCCFAFLCILCMCIWHCTHELQCCNQ